VVLTSGDRYDVVQPELAVLMATQMYLAEPRSDRFHLIRLNQIVAIDVPPHAA
jgi:hypothetical protein